MKNKLVWALMTAGLLGAGVAGGYWFAMHRMIGASVAPPDVANAADKKPLYYYDPMYPQQKFDKPGKSPFMDMMLVPVYGDDGADSGSVKISPRIVQNLGIRTALITQGALDKKIEVVGAVAFDERAVALVQARVNGFIEKLFVRAPLDPVKKGQPLAEILAPDWVAAQEEYLTLRRSPLANDALRQAARQRLVLLGMDERTIAAIETEGRTRPRITLLAPISGVVGELAVREGMTVMPGSLLFRINGLSSVWINADVPEIQAAWLKPGSALTATVPAYPGVVFNGRVTALLPDINPSTRTLRARIEMANPKGQLVPGMFATLEVASRSRQDVLLVPSEAVIQTGKRAVVILVDNGQDGKQQFVPTDIELGGEANGLSEIRGVTAGSINAGMKVVVSGQFLIDSEASLKSTSTRMGEASVAAPAANPAEGVIEAIDADGVTISHGPIPSMKMGAMTMAFKAPPSGVPAEVKVGSKVAFDVMLTPQGEFALRSIQPKTAATSAQKTAPNPGAKEGAGK